MLMYYCDHCGAYLPEIELVHYERLPFYCESANKGESGSVCKDCDERGHTNIAEWLGYWKKFEKGE